MDRKLKILHLEDLSSDAELVSKALKKGMVDFERLVVDSREKFTEALEEFFPDVILADHSLPSFNSHEALILFHKTGRKIPFILVTVAMSEEFAVDVIKKGADDYILKDRLSRLPGAIRNTLEKFRLEKDSSALIEELKNNERHYRALVENGTDAVVILDIHGKPTYVSPSVKRVLGYSELEAMQQELYKILHPDDQQDVVKKMAECASRPGIPLEGNVNRIKHRDGSWIWIEATITNMLDDPAINGIVSNFRDITFRKHAEERILHANRLYAFISEINQAIVHSQDEQTVFKEVCRIATELGKFEAAWVGIVDDDKNQISLVQESGLLPEDINAFTRESCSVGPQYQVLRTDSYFVCNNIENCTDLNHWKAFGISKGYKSIMVLPIRKSSGIIGTFNLYSSEIDFFSSAEIALLEEATADISFSIKVFEKEKLRTIAEKNLIDNQTRLNHAQAIAHIGSWEMDLATGIALWSEELLNIYGLPLKEINQSYASWLSFIHPDDVDYVIKITREAEEKGTDSAFYHRIIRTDGTVRHLYAQAQSKFDSEKKIIGVYGVAHDITTIKSTEEALRKSEFRYRQIVETAQEGIWVIDENNITTFANKKMCDILEYSNSEMLGKTNTFFMDDVSRHLASSAIQRKEIGVAEAIDFSYITKSGRHIKTKVSANPIFDEDGRYEGALAMVADVTEKVLADEMLQESEFRYREIAYEMQLESSRLVEAQAVAKVGSWEVDLDSLKVNWSDETYRIFETDSRRFQVTISAIMDFVDPVDRNQVESAFHASLESNSPNSFEHKIIAANGVEKSVIEHWKIIRNEIGHPISAMGTCQDISDNKKANEEIRFKANLLNTIGQAVIATDLNGVVSYWNNAAEKIYGWTTEEAIGKNIAILTPSCQTKHQTLEIIEQLDLGNPWTGEFIVKRKDGSDFPAFVTDSPIFNQQNELCGMVGISSDITEKKKLEELLDKAKNLARLGSWEVDLIKGTIYWSAMTRQIHEVSTDFVPDLETAINFYKEGVSRKSIEEALKKGSENGIPWDLELEVVTAKGNVRWVRTMGEAAFLNSECIKLTGSFQDIDVRKRAEIEFLKVSEEKNTILESIGDGFYAVDKNWTVTYWNKEGEILLGRKREDMVGKNLWEEYPDTIGSVTDTNYRKALNENKSQHYERFNETLNRWAEISVYPSPNGLSIFFKDITERKFSEIRLNELNANLETYTRELVISNKGLEQFSYIVSHNLRAPVANIIGLSELLNDPSYNPEMRSTFNKELTLSVKRLDNVIVDLNHILQVKKDITEQKEVVNLTELIADVQSSIQNLIEKDNVCIKTDFRDINEFTTLPSYLHSIFYNLISNSIKYRRPNLQPVIEISSEKINDTLVITINDNGMGIDLIKRGDQVFGLYKRFHKNIEGKGMGLFMVKTQVETLGGKITIASEIDQGTTFTIEFKLNQF